MPLLALLGQLTSTCSLKSENFRSVAMFEPASLFTRQPSFTVQLDAFSGLSKYQPEWSRPLNKVIGSRHITRIGGLRAGARLPVQVHGVPSGPWAVPLNVLPANFPSKIKSVLLPSSSFGETNWIVLPVTVTVGRKRAWPQRPTKRALQISYS